MDCLTLPRCPQLNVSSFYKNIAARPHLIILLILKIIIEYIEQWEHNAARKLMREKKYIYQIIFT